MQITIKTKPLINSIFFSLLIVLTSCDAKKPEVSAKDHLDLARLYIKQGSFKASIIEAKNALQLEPNNVETLTTMSTTLIQLNDYNSANKVISRAIEIDNNNEDLKVLLAKTQLLQRRVISANKTIADINPDTIKNLIDYNNTKADILFASKKYSDAKQWYKKSIQSDNKNMTALIGSAKSAAALKQSDEAEKYTQLAISYYPNNIEALIWQAQVYIFKNQYFEAETTLSKAMIELERYDTLTSNKYITITLLAQALMSQGKVEESFKYSNYLIQTTHGKIQSAYKNAFSLLSEEHNIIEAEKAFQAVLQQAPNHSPSGVMLGLINYSKGNYTLADEYLSKFANDESSPLRGKKILALTKIKLNQIDQAIEILSQSIKQHSKDADLHGLLGYAYLNSQKIEKSIKELELATTLSANNAIYYTHLARAYLKKKNTKKALKFSHKALKLKPDSSAAKLVLINTYLTGNQIKKAKLIADSWLKEFPDSVPALNISATIALEKNQKSQAKTLFLKTLSLDPDNLIANMNMVRFDLNDRKLGKAYERLYLVINQNPENTQALTMLYTIARNTNSLDSIEKILKTVIEKNPETINSRLVLAQYYINVNTPIKTLVIFDEITKLDNKNIKAYILKAKALLLQNKNREAVDTYLLSASLDHTNPIGFTELAQYYLQENNYKLAIDYSKKALAIQNDYIAAHLILGKSAINIKDKELAMNSIQALRQKIPLSYLPLEMEADLHSVFNNNKLTILKLQQAWKKHQNIRLAEKIKNAYIVSNQDQRAFLAWHELSKKQPNNIKLQISYALSLQKANHFDAAQQTIESQLKRFPDNIILLNNLANLYLITNDKRALETAKLAFERSPQNPAIQDTLGWIYSKQHKDYEKAIPLLTQAFTATSNPEIKRHLSKTLTMAGRDTEAQQLEK